MMKTKLFTIIPCIIVMAANVTHARLYGDPPTDNNPWQVHDESREQPKVVVPGNEPGAPPADAIVLFNGKDISQWEADKPEKNVPSKWRIVDGALESVKKAGYIRTKQAFGDCQLHVEWATPSHVMGSGQGRGNSGVFLMGKYEVQVLDCYQNQTYPDGQAGSVYGQNPPMVNVSRAPGKWQTYDIIFRQPRMKDGKLVRPGYMTVIQNGVVVQDNWQLEGPTKHKARTKLAAHPDKSPLKLQDHGNPVRYRNIWIRELPERSIGGLQGIFADPATVKAKRADSAAKLRKTASTMKNDIEKLQVLMNSLAYEKDPETVKSVDSILTRYLTPLKDGDKKKAQGQKNAVMALRNSIKYLVKHKILPQDFAPKKLIEEVIRKHGLDKK